MSTVYTSTPYATIPNPLTIEFHRDWYRSLALFRAETENDHTVWTSIYVQQGPLSDVQAEAGNVFQCINTAALQSLLATYQSIHTEGLRVRVKAGSVYEWFTEEAVDLNRANITLEKWGEGNNPLFHGTATLADLGVASLGTPTGGVYSVTLGSTELDSRPVTHFLEDWGSTPRDAANFARKYHWKTSSGAVTAAGQFHYNSGTRVLTFYPLADAPDVSITGFRLVLHTGSTYSGMIQLENFDAIKVIDIDVIGTGGNGNQASDQNWGISSYCKDTNAHVIHGCLSIYNGVHAIGQYCSTQGGIITIMHCVVGFQKHYQSIPIVAYADQGEQEYIEFGNTVLEWLPNDNHSTVIERATQCCYSHDSDGTNPASLVIHAEGDYACGLYGYGSGPYCGNPPNTANPDHGSLNKISDARVFIINCRMRGNGSLAGASPYESAKNFGNTPRIHGVQSGHVLINAWFDSYGFNRTTDTATIEYFEIGVTDYDYRGWAVNCVWDITVGAVTGTHNFALLRNNLSGGTEPDRQGVWETMMFNCTHILRVPAGLNITGTWNCLSWQQNGTIATATGNLNNGPNRMSWYNSLMVNISAANSTEDIVLGIPEADPDGPRYQDAALSTARGGVQRSGFYGYRDQEADQGGFRNFGTEYFVANTSSLALATAPTDPLAFPASDAEWVVASATALHTSANSEIVEYDFHGRTRPSSGSRALGAVEYSGADTQGSSQQASAMSSAIGLGIGF